MFKEIRSYTVPLTREVATEVATMPGWKGERKLRKDRVAYLDAAIRDGRFHSPSWAFAWLDGKKMRVNGQHSSTALAEANGYFPVGLNVIMQEFSCDSIFDVAALFATFDRPESIRNTRECLGAAKAIHGELDDVNPYIASMIVAGIASALRGDGAKTNVSIEDRSRLLHSNLDFVMWANSIIGHKKRILQRACVIATMFKTWRKDADQSRSFWEMVLRNDHPEVTHPTRKLHDLLLEATMRTKLEGSNKQSAWSMVAIHVKCIHAWNAYRRGTTTDLKYYASSPIPEVI